MNRVKAFFARLFGTALPTRAPVAGLNSRQSYVAAQLISAVQARKLPPRAAIIVIETGIVESSLQVLANPNVPESMNIPHDGVGQDHASVGPLQQQVPMWGTAADCMNPITSANKFLDKLTSFNWQSMSTGDAAQTVQVSAFPDRYQQQETWATQIVNALWVAPKPTPIEDEMHIITAPQATAQLLVTSSGNVFEFPDTDTRDAWSIVFGLHVEMKDQKTWDTLHKRAKPLP